MSIDDYTIAEHSHRFAAWAASRAASVTNCRFSVQRGRAMLEACGLNSELASPGQLPEVDDMDNEHAKWRRKIIEVGKKEQLNLTHGVAAKLINVYLKSRFVCGGHSSHQKVAVLHPPIDRLLLRELTKANFADNADLWRTANRTGWTKINSDQYQNLINEIRAGMDGRPLWKIEDYWRGHQ